MPFFLFFSWNRIRWFWYQDPKFLEEEKPQSEVTSKPSQEKPKTLEAKASEILTDYKKKLEQKLHLALVSPTPTNVRNYMTWQKDMMKRSNQFSKTWQQMVITHPELNTETQFPTAQYARHVHGDQMRQAKEKTIRSLAHSFFNRLNINSCESAAALVGAAWPKSDLGSQSVCRMISAHSGSATDWAIARHECGVNRDSKLGSSAQKDLLVGEFNLAWKVLEKMDISFDDSETNLSPFPEEGLTSEENQTLKEIFMTLSGTIIHKKGAGGGDDHITLRAKGDQEAFLNALMSGGKIRYYKCDTKDKCLNPTETDLVLAKDKSLHQKIQATLADLVSKIQNDDGTQEATPAQKAIVNISTLPIYKIINVTTAFQKGRAPISIHEYSKLIAFDILYPYINEVFNAFQEGANKLREMQFTDEYLKEFVDGIRESRQNLNQFRQSIFAKMDLMLGFIEKVQLIEKQIHHMVGSLSNEYGQ